MYSFQIFGDSLDANEKSIKLGFNISHKTCKHLQLYVIQVLWFHTEKSFFFIAQNSFFPKCKYIQYIVIIKFSKA